MTDQDLRSVPILKHYYQDPSEQREVLVSGLQFEASDGWQLRATIHEAARTSHVKVPGVVLLAEPGLRLRNIFGVLAEPLAKAGFAVLSLDMRGSAGSFGRKDFEKFTPTEVKDLQLDVRAAIEALSKRGNVDGNRIAVLGAGTTAEYAVLEAAQNPGVRALILMTPQDLSDSALALIQKRDNVPVLSIAGYDQPKYLQRNWAEPYFRSTHPNSRLVFGIDQGPTMIFRRGGLIETIVDWLSVNLARLPMEQQVTFKSEGEWTLSGTLYMPTISQHGRVPGVVFAHGLNHSEQSWSTIPREVAEHGMATLAFDWRGTRKSINQGRPEVGVDMSFEDLQSIYLDIRAAANFLTAQEGVDSDRLGLVSATAVCNHIVRAAIGDPRVKSLVALSFLMPTPDVREYLATTDTPIFVVASTEDVNPDGSSLVEGSRAAYEASRSKRSQFLLYDNAGRGNGMPFAKPELKGMMTRWLQETLGVPQIG